MEKLPLSSLFFSEIEGEKIDDPNFKIKTPSPEFSPKFSRLLAFPEHGWSSLPTWSLR